MKNGIRNLFIALLVCLLVVGSTMVSAEASLEGFKVAWQGLFPSTFQELVKGGVERWAAQHPEAEVLTNIGVDKSTSTQQSDLEAFAAKGVKYMSIYPADNSFINGIAEEFAAMDITTVTFSAQPLWPSQVKFCVGVDYGEAAITAARFLFDYLGGKGNIINVLDLLTDPNTAARKAGIDSVFASYPDIVRLEETTGGVDTIEEATQKITDLIALYADEVDGIITTGGRTAVGMANALADYYANGGTRKIVGIAIDTDPTVMKGIEEGYLIGTIAQNAEGMGYLSMEVLSLFYQGYDKAAEAPNLIDVGHVVVTLDNMNNYEADLAVVADNIAADLTTRYLTK